MSSIIPSIGRKVWFWASEDFQSETGCEPAAEKQPFDATVVFVNKDGSVNLHVVDHGGEAGFVEYCELRDPGEDDCHGGEYDFATWMPYQVIQSRKNFDEAKKEESGS